MDARVRPVAGSHAVEDAAAVDVVDDDGERRDRGASCAGPGRRGGCRACAGGRARGAAHVVRARSALQVALVGSGDQAGSAVPIRGRVCVPRPRDYVCATARAIRVAREAWRVHLPVIDANRDRQPPRQLSRRARARRDRDRHVVRRRARRVAASRADRIAHAALPGSSVPMLREACILEALRHAGLPAVYESGLLADDRPWFAFEDVCGERLSEALARGPLRPIEVARLIRDVARVLEHAHRRGVVHGALRPERIVLTGAGRGFAVCITEWGSARTYDAAPAIPHLPTPGSRAYLAPEAQRGDAIDDRADIYALGLLACQALTGSLPAATLPLTVRERCPRAPRELAIVIDQMLAHDRFDRPSSAEVLGDIAWVTEGAEALQDLPAVAEVELVDIDDAVDADAEADAIAAAAEPPLRIRKPRWTPNGMATFAISELEREQQRARGRS